MKFTLGTASFGSKYGVANQDGEMSDNECLRVLDRAKVLNIESLDTAPIYGTAESLIGRFHTSNQHFDVYSKISETSTFSSANILSQIHESRERLRIRKFAAILFHKSDFLKIESRKVINLAIHEILESGLASKVGVSVYNESEVEYVVKRFPEIKLFQVPENVMDRRLLNSKLISELAAVGFEFHVRSIFLQGLLMMDERKLNRSLAPALQGLVELRQFCKQQEINILDLCLNYARQIEWATNAVVGVNTPEQLTEIVNHSKRDLDLTILPHSFPDLILDPRRWQTK